MNFSRVEKLILYRRILLSAKSFPSIKKQKIIEEIRSEFRAKKSLTDEKEIRMAIDVATKGLHQLSMYSSLNQRSSTWSVSLDNCPMPAKEKPK
jgi:cytochrome c oxidase assembly factor 4